MVVVIMNFRQSRKGERIKVIRGDILGAFARMFVLYFILQGHGVLARFPLEMVAQTAMSVDRGKISSGERQTTVPGQRQRDGSGRSRYATFTLCFLLIAFLAACGSQKSIVRPTVQVNNTQIITNTMYMGEAFAFPETSISASLLPRSTRLTPSEKGVSFIGIIAQDTTTLGCSQITPCDVVRVGMFRQKNSSFLYGYEINNVISYAKEPLVNSDYRYNIDFFLNEEGPVEDPAYPHQHRFGYEFHVASGIADVDRVNGLQSSLFYGDQIFIGVMDSANNVSLPTNKSMQLSVWASGGEKSPDVIYTNEDQTSQVSSQYSDSDFSITLTLSGSY